MRGMIATRLRDLPGEAHRRGTTPRRWPLLPARFAEGEAGVPVDEVRARGAGERHELEVVVEALTRGDRVHGPVHVHLRLPNTALGHEHVVEQDRMAAHRDARALAAA